MTGRSSFVSGFVFGQWSFVHWSLGCMAQGLFFICILKFYQIWWNVNEFFKKEHKSKHQMWAKITAETLKRVAVLLMLLWCLHSSQKTRSCYVNLILDGKFVGRVIKIETGKILRIIMIFFDNIFVCIWFLISIFICRGCEKHTRSKQIDGGENNLGKIKISLR